ncbi:lipopolysaccharide biosynthesis protein [Halomicrobium urmianum]|uniref:lipopolysaccharide biosynthesis protein n=1 Tax=Halomicrobium urmianum TaxID=1586233 RepID=UPI001CDA091E|nr:lipopolysaccharide biosynthesis protein [Halomicrobium urmianum]
MADDRLETTAGADADRADGDRHERSASAPDPVEQRLDDALERVAHGATVSVPGILVRRGLALAFTAVLTNGFTAGAYGTFAVARRLQRFLLHVALGFRRGLSRFLPAAESTAERDALVTVASLLLVGVATVFGTALYVAVPHVTRAAGEGPQFQTLLRVFAVGLPASVWLFTVTEVLRGLEEVVPLTLTLRVGFPVAQLAVGAVGVLVGDLVFVAGGVVLAMGAVGLTATGWLARNRGLRPRAPGADGGRIWRRYVDYSLPLFAGGFATVTQRFGFYPLIALFLSGVAGGVFAVAVLLGLLVRLPLLGVNQFIPPVMAALHEAGHRDALRRLYQVTSRLVLVGVTGITIPLLVYREAALGLFGPTFVEYAALLPGFLLAQYVACAAGSVGLLLMMTDNQRAYLIVNVAITAVLAAIAVPLTIRYGLPGLVLSYFLMYAVNNGLEVVVLYYLEGLQPFTRLHLRPVAAAVPLAVVTLGAHATLPAPAAPAVGTLLGLTAYALVLRRLGFTPVERRLAETMIGRYRDALGRD